MQQLRKLTQQEAIHIAHGTARNARDLYKTALLAAGKKYNGIALSILVLAAEEYAKAIILLLRAHEIEVLKIDQVFSAFSDQKKNHELSTLVELISTIFFILVEFKDWYNEQKELKSRFYILSILKELNTDSRLVGPIIEFYSKYKWWEKADLLKHRNIYIDKNNELKLPETVSDSDLDIAVHQVKGLRSSYRILYILLNRLALDQKKKLVDEINSGIKKFIKNM